MREGMAFPVPHLAFNFIMEDWHCPDSFKKNGIFLPSKRGQVQNICTCPSFDGRSNIIISVTWTTLHLYVQNRKVWYIPAIQARAGAEEYLHLTSLDGRSNIVISVTWTLREWCSYVFFTPSRSLRAKIPALSHRLWDGAGNFPACWFWSCLNREIKTNPCFGLWQYLRPR